MNVLIVLLVAIAPDGRMDFVQRFDGAAAQRNCSVRAEELALQSKRHLPQPYSYACLPATKTSGKL